MSHSRATAQYSNEEATAEFTRKIYASLESLFPTVNNLSHALAQWFGGREFDDDVNSLSFVDRIYKYFTAYCSICDSNATYACIPSARTGEAPIASVQVLGVSKWRDPVKVYRYKLRVEREGCRIPDDVHRSYAEFYELSAKIARK